MDNTVQPADGLPCTAGDHLEYKPVQPTITCTGERERERYMSQNEE